MDEADSDPLEWVTARPGGPVRGASSVLPGLEWGMDLLKGPTL